MPTRITARVIDAHTARGVGEDGLFPFGDYALRALAQGDSWFSIGALPPGKTSNLLLEMRSTRRIVIVQCADPGKVLRRFTDTTREGGFLRELDRPSCAPCYDVILISGGGNDLIDAAGSPPDAPPDRRLLRTPAERGASPPPAGYVSEPGWATFAAHLRAVFNGLLDRRDQGPHKGVPLLLHNYARVMPRPSGAGLGQGPWLLPALQAYAVPPTALLPVADELLGRLAALLQQCIAERHRADPGCAVQLVDTLGKAGVALSLPGTTGSSGDWVNEIHLTRAGLRKCTAVWAEALEALPLEG
jgi:hypothetical protein